VQTYQALGASIRTQVLQLITVFSVSNVLFIQSHRSTVMMTNLAMDAIGILVMSQIVKVLVAGMIIWVDRSNIDMLLHTMSAFVLSSQVLAIAG
jgi:hypothetical protein